MTDDDANVNRLFLEAATGDDDAPVFSVNGTRDRLPLLTNAEKIGKGEDQETRKSIAQIPTSVDKPKRKSRKSTPRKRVTLSAEATDIRADAGRTDSANALRLVQFFGDDLHWVEPWGKWLAWDGRRWAIDAERRVDAWSKEVAAALWNQAATILPDVDPVTAKELTAHCRYTAGAKGITNMLTLGKSEPGIAILPEKLDADPWVLNCCNGTIDLRTGQLRQHERGDLCTKLCATEYVAGNEAECPLWEQTVDRIFGGNLAICGFVQRLLGASICGTVIEHILPIFWGDGSNGKSVLLETILDVLGGDFACKVRAEMLLASKSDRHPTEVADLHGKRLVVASETDNGRRLREGLLKEITGGDRLKGRRMREDFWEFSPSHTLILLTNHRPIVQGVDHGVWRRLRLVPFVQKFWDPDRGETGDPELRADKRLREKLAQEHDGILRWLVNGCIRWQQDGLKEPDEVTSATADYRANQDVLGAFISEHCVEGHAFASKASDVYATYVAWCKASGEHAINLRRFGDALTERGVDRYKSDGVWYRGLGLVSEPSEPSEHFS